MDRGLSNAELAVSSGIERQRLHGRGGERGRRLPPEKSVSWARRRAGRERGGVGGESGLRHVREKAVCGRFTQCALCVASAKSLSALVRRPGVSPVNSGKRQQSSLAGVTVRHTQTVSMSLLPGFMGRRQWSLSMTTSSGQDVYVLPTIVRRQIEAIRPKRASPGIALSLSSEKGLIG